MDNKKNTILLTVIAVATLLVAVVGATFAYFTAQEGSIATANITVKTGTAASTNLTAGSAIAIYADQSNFAENQKSLVGETTGKVVWTAPGSTETYTPDTTARTYCYTVTLKVSSNDFQYDATNSETGTAQLLFNVFKKASGAADYSEITENVDLTYINSVTGMSTATAGQSTTFKGYDITKVKSNTDIAIGSRHNIVAEETTKGAAVTPMTDVWKASVTLVNLAEPQNYNTNKTFSASLVFDNCES